MIFKTKKDIWYPKYWESENYSLGVAYETFGRFKIQFMHRLGNDNWQVIREWTSYKWELIEKTIRSIFKSLKEIPDLSPKAKLGDKRHWEIVSEFLPESRNKLLED